MTISRNVGCAVFALVAIGASGCGSADTSAQSEEPGPDASLEDAWESESPDSDASSWPDTPLPEAAPDASEEADAAEAGDDAAWEASGPVRLRYLAINAGNASPQYGCWEYKLCRPQDVAHIRDYITKWQPDVVMISEVLREAQLGGTEAGGPILPAGYEGRCGKSRDRVSGEPAAWNASGASHEHECVAWRKSRVAPVPGSELSAYGRNDPGHESCSYDFTGFRMKLVIDGTHELTAVTVHPNSTKLDCRMDEISRYWSELASGSRVIIGGDWNTDQDSELQVPSGFLVNFSKGHHWTLAYHSEDYSAEYALGLQKRHLDHSFSSFGGPDITELPFGSALGGYDGHPRADEGEGMDHRQQLVDVVFQP